jgi:hypothetical protein
MSRPLSRDPRPVRLAPVDLLGLGLLGVRTRKARAALSALGIAIGIATLVLVTGIPASSQHALDDELSRLGTNRLQATAVPDQDPPILLPPESMEMVSRIGPVTVASAVANTHLTVARSDRGDENDFNALTVLASKANLLEAIEGSVRTGRFLDGALEHFPTAVLGSVAAQRLGFPDLDPAAPAPQVYIGRRPGDDSPRAETKARAFGDEIIRQFTQDIHIWCHQRYSDPPALAGAEQQGFTAIRNWAKQFYPDGIGGSAAEVYAQKGRTE